LLLQARFLAYNSPKTVWPRTRWKSSSALPDSLAAKTRGLLLRKGEGKKWDRMGGEGTGGEKRRGGRREGKGRWRRG